MEAIRRQAPAGAQPARLVIVLLNHDGEEKFTKQAELLDVLREQGIEHTGLHPVYAGFSFVLNRGIHNPLNLHMDPNTVMTTVSIDGGAQASRY